MSRGEVGATMLRIAVMAEYPLLAELVAAALREDRRLDVTAVVGDRQALRAPALRETLATAQAVLYVPNGPIESVPWREAKHGARQVLVLADLTGQVGLERALRLGARGYIGPQESRPALAQRVLQAADGVLAAPPSWIVGLQGAIRQLMREELRMQRLTHDEEQLVRWVARGDSGKEIAVRLRISLPAARSRIRRVLEKLEVRNERELAALAALAGLYPGEGDDLAESDCS
jgi:two-component system nitrate/nitrite response regulator NarL